ncbi:hypothetical protein C7477_104133 [Phyllobacterium leguminum]|uniref:Uncharacterized protein n=1 Tax=Phyllobacterium leguminum TaxID=314237 RepID=A0A318T558_9HYPH|nr:hypothetical protein C7477_104133 [Phyllobacterium leguminum]
MVLTERVSDTQSANCPMRTIFQGTSYHIGNIKQKNGQVAKLNFA